MNIAEKNFLLSLPVKLTTIPKSLGVKYNGEFCGITLRSWMTFFVNHGCWHCLLGLDRPDPPRERAILKEFWRRYRILKPGHELWQLVDSKNMDLSRTVPLLLHGDEGRGYKKSPFLICAYHSYLGKGTHLANSTRTHRPYLAMRLNYVGNSWSHRYVTAVLPKMCKDKLAFEDIMKFITKDCLDVVNNGVSDASGNIYHAAILQCVGDWMFLVKAGNLARSFNHVEKRPRAVGAQPVGICHYCLAGTLEFPFEDFSVNAAWKSSEFQRGDFPFTSLPTLLALPHETNRPGAFFTYDLWHAYHLGMGKSFLGAVLALMSQKMEGSQIDVRFQRLTDLFLTWAQEHKRTTYITSLTKEGIQWPDKGSFPNGNWHKGHVTSTLMDFVTWALGMMDLEGEVLLIKSREAACAIGGALTAVWLSRSVANSIGKQGLKHMELYQELATIAYHQHLNLFAFMPKQHICSHIFNDLANTNLEFCLSPLCHAVQIDEDMVGKCSRVSRRVSAMQVVKRVLQRAKLATFNHFVKCGYLKPL